MDTLVFVWVVAGTASTLVGIFGVMASEDSDSWASSVFLVLLFTGLVLLFVAPLAVIVAMNPTGPTEIVIAASFATAAIEMVLMNRAEGVEGRRATVLDAASWCVLVLWACIVFWQIQRLFDSDAQIEEKWMLPSSFLGAVAGVPLYLWVVVPIQEFFELGEVGQRFVRLGVALAFGLIIQEVLVRTGLIPRL